VTDFSETINAAKAIADPSARAKKLGRLLDAVPDLQRTLREERQRAFQELHASGLSWAQIGEDQGVDRTRAAQIARGVSGGSMKPKAAQ
jgi:hypothetical protein